jgi:hypothetical protein
MLAGIRQETHLQGYLIAVGDPENPCRVMMRDGSAILTNLAAPAALAVEMANHLGQPVRLNGTGSWRRTTEGAWQLE